MRLVNALVLERPRISMMLLNEFSLNKLSPKCRDRYVLLPSFSQLLSNLFDFITIHTKEINQSVGQGIDEYVVHPVSLWRSDFDHIYK
jgi:hypothetical protein